MLCQCRVCRDLTGIVTGDAIIAVEVQQLVHDGDLVLGAMLCFVQDQDRNLALALQGSFQLLSIFLCILEN